MRRTIQALAAASMLSIPLSAHAASEDWRSEITRDYVSARDGRLCYESTSICRADGEKNVQLRTVAEAADSAVSRDFFVSFVTARELGFVFRLQIAIAARGHKGVLDCSNLQGPIGKPDVTLELVITADGYQVQELGPGGEVALRETKSWAEVYEKK